MVQNLGHNHPDKCINEKQVSTYDHFFNLQKHYWPPCPIVQWRILQQLSFSRFLSVSLFFIAMMKTITMTCKLMSKHLSLDKMLVDRDIKASRDSTPLPTSVTTIFTFLVFCWKLFFFWNYHPSTPALFTGERRGVKRLIVSASPALTSDNEYKMENSIWELLGESVKERVSSCCFCCFGLLLTFCCLHAADTEGRDADSLVWLWQASHRF